MATSGSHQQRLDAWVRRAAALSAGSLVSDSGDCELQTLLINILLATEPFWSTLAAPVPIFGEEFLEAVLQVGKPDGS